MIAALRELVHHRHLVLSFAQRDIRARYKQTIFGVAWAIVQPFSMMVVFTLVFDKFARVPSDGVPYPIFSYSALIFWAFFATTISQGTVAMTANSNLVRKIYFPRETLLLAVLLSAGLDLLVASTIFGGMFVYYHVAPSWALLWIVPLLAVQVLFTLTVIFISSAVHVYFRDIGHALPLLLQLWMFATPVAYPLSLVPDWLRPFYVLNPMVTIIDGYRRAILRGEPPDVTALGLSLLLVTLAAGSAYAVFKRAERTFADVI
jgi:ABC-type polysaccharide/polyol phosphate export permease